VELAGQTLGAAVYSPAPILFHLAGMIPCGPEQPDVRVIMR